MIAMGLVLKEYCGHHKTSNYGDDLYTFFKKRGLLSHNQTSHKYGSYGMYGLIKGDGILDW